MAEQGTEMILPGTYIEVRAEGLLAGGRDTPQATLALWARPKWAVRTLLFSVAIVMGTPSSANPAIGIPPNHANVHLVRALRYLFKRQRLAHCTRGAPCDSATAQASSFTLLGNTGQPLVSARARTPGAWGNRLQELGWRRWRPSSWWTTNGCCAPTVHCASPPRRLSRDC